MTDQQVHDMARKLAKYLESDEGKSSLAKAADATREKMLELERATKIDYKLLYKRYGTVI
jgi:hypothetical protein